MAETVGSDLKWGVRKRLEFIEFRLFWDGRLNRGDLAEVFGMSHQQASSDFGTYQKLAPDNLVYDNALKAYIRTPEFDPVLIGDNSDRYLLQVVAIHSGWMQKEDTWFNQLPPVEVVTLGRKPLNTTNLLAVLDAIRERKKLQIDYRSMTGTPESWRWIAPHAMSFCAGRWYVRAWSEEHNDFRDYSLGRILETRGSTPASENSALDYEWAQRIDLIIGPNPQLSEDRQRAVEFEYNMVNAEVLVPVRLSLSFYLMSEHNLDVQPGQLLPEKQQLVLKNRQDVEDARRLARQMSKEALKRGGA
ncbi:WYL domain-containing protein [Mesorhizobium sp. M0045]|uniref:helix-turn-helix transcriptional regulator n=1 Tax=Mesorhizobium sp. M0045 TaxID=2956857 RepID=UPI003337F9CA